MSRYDFKSDIIISFRFSLLILVLFFIQRKEDANLHYEGNFVLLYNTWNDSKNIEDEGLTLLFQLPFYLLFDRQLDEKERKRGKGL